MEIRLATANDAEAVLKIYAPFIISGAITFETEVPTVKQMAERIEHYLEKFPWLVAVENNVVVGYSYASTYRERSAYQWSVESSVYVNDNSRGKGIADKLYKQLFEILEQQGVRNIYAIITLPNIASEKFHAKHGFEKFAVFENVGFKSGQWHNVLWMVNTLNSFNETPNPLIPFFELRNQFGFEIDG